MNTYGYAGGDPVSSSDPIGLFQFGTRPLNGIPFKINWGTNLNVLHEHGFYDNGADIGYFPSGITSDSPENIQNYIMFGPYYEDGKIHEALLNLERSGLWNPEITNQNNGYDLLGNNCQDFSDALRNEYKNLNGKICSKKFVNSKCPVICKITTRGIRCK